MDNTVSPLETLRAWSPRHWLVALVVSVLSYVVVALPTDLIDNPVFGREIPPTWWSRPALAISSVLAGLLVATYVGSPVTQRDPEQRKGWVGAVLTFFAVGCPVCNKLVLLALGSAGAITWFQPLQPVLQALAIGLLGYALVTRLRTAQACPVPSP